MLCLLIFIYSQNHGGYDKPPAPGADEPDAATGKGYYVLLSQKLAARTVFHQNKVRSDANIKKVIDIWGLKDFSDEVQGIADLSSGNDGEVFKAFIKYDPYALKLYKTGLNEQFVFFQQALFDKRDSAEAKRPAGVAVYHVAVPVGYLTHLDKVGLLFRYIVEPEPSRGPTQDDQNMVEAQMKFCHWLGYLHLDITPRNILLSRDGKAFLMDYDAVCQIGKVPLGPIPPESSNPVKRRDPAGVSDDLHLWQLTLQSYFGMVCLVCVHAFRQDTYVVACSR